MKYGGLGGVRGGRKLDPTDAFEMACERALGAAIRADKDVGIRLWESITNQDWVNGEGDTASYSFRRAGDVVAAIRACGEDYMDFYCMGSPGQPRHDIVLALSREGWVLVI